MDKINCILSHQSNLIYIDVLEIIKHDLNQECYFLFILFYKTMWKHLMIHFSWTENRTWTMNHEPWTLYLKRKKQTTHVHKYSLKQPVPSYFTAVQLLKAANSPTPLRQCWCLIDWRRVWPRWRSCRRSCPPLTVGSARAYCRASTSRSRHHRWSAGGGPTAGKIKTFACGDQNKRPQWKKVKNVFDMEISIKKTLTYLCKHIFIDRNFQSYDIFLLY